MALDILVALAQRLRMADDGADGIRRGTVHAEQTMGDVEIEHLVDEQLAREEQIHHRADLAGVAVFEREDDAVNLAALHGVVRRGEVGVGDETRLREHTPRGDVGVRALHAAVGDLHPLHQAGLVGTGEVDDLAQELRIVGADGLVADAGGAARDQLTLALGVAHGKPSLTLKGATCSLICIRSSNRAAIFSSMSLIFVLI